MAKTIFIQILANIKYFEKIDHFYIYSEEIFLP